MVGSLFKGPDSKVSMMRFISFFVCFSIIVVFIVHNIVAITKGGGFVSIGSTEAMLIAGVIGAKAVQSFSENKGNIKKLPDDVMPTSEGG